MRIGIDATALPAQPVGAGNYILQLVRHLGRLESQHELFVIAARSRRSLIEDRPLPGLKWVELPDRPPALRLAWEQTGLPRLARRLRLDLLHSPHYTRPVWLPCPSLVTLHDMTFFLFPHLHTRARRLFFPAMIRYSARTAQGLIAVSESTRQDAIRLLGVSPQRIQTVPLGVDAEYHPHYTAEQRQAVARQYKLPDHFILYVGLVEPRKNLPGLLSAYASLAQDQPNLAPLVIVGRRGWGMEQVLTQLEQLRIQERVLFTGYVPAADLPVVYNLADIFVYPSLYEGFGLPPLEALACGTPVITTAVSSMPEHIGAAGLLVPPGDVAALSQALNRLLGDPALQAELRRLGPQQAAAFTWERTARETMSIYSRLGNA